MSAETARQIPLDQNRPTTDLKLVHPPAATPEKPNYWVEAFDLARELKRDDVVDPEELIPEVEAWCTSNGRSFEDLLEYFLDAYPQVKVASGEEVLANALAAAESQPYPCNDYIATYQRAVSVAYHLSGTSPERTFYFAARVAEALGVEQRTANRYLQRMVKSGLIELVSVYEKGKKCNVYRFLGDAIAAAETPSPIEAAPTTEPTPQVEQVLSVEVETMKEAVRQHVEVANKERQAGRLATADVEAAVANAVKWGGHKFLVGKAQSGRVTTAFVAAVDGAVYLGCGESTSDFPSPSGICPALAYVVRRGASPETVDAKIREWVASGKAVRVADCLAAGS